MTTTETILQVVKYQEGGRDLRGEKKTDWHVIMVVMFSFISKTMDIIQTGHANQNQIVPHTSENIAYPITNFR